MVGIAVVERLSFSILLRQIVSASVQYTQSSQSPSHAEGQYEGISRIAPVWVIVVVVLTMA